MPLVEHDLVDGVLTVALADVENRNTLSGPLLRELIHPPVRMVYRRDLEHVRIVRIWRSERLLRRPGKQETRDDEET